MRALDLLAGGNSPISILEKVFLERAAWTEKNPELTKVFFEQRIHQFLFREDDALVRVGANSAKGIVEQSENGHNGS